MTNLLEETNRKLIYNNKTWEDVLWIGGKDFTISIDNFKAVADDAYDNGFGAPEVAQDLKIVGEDWWLEREEYDGAENWSFKTLPIKPTSEQKVKRVITTEIGWRDLSEISKE